MNATQLGSRILLGALVAFSAGISAGGVGDLSYTTTAPPSLDVSGGQFTLKTPAKPGEIGLTHPKAMVTGKGPMVTSGGATVTIDGKPVAMAFDSDDATAELLDVLRIDMTGRGDFTSAVTVKLTREAKFPLFKLPRRPITVITKAGRKITVLLSGKYYNNKKRVFGVIYLLAMAQGECRFGDTVRKVLILDSNANHTLGDVVVRTRGERQFARADYCLIADAKGQFTTHDCNTFMRIDNPTRVGGKWYALTCEKMKIAAKPVDKVGMLSINAPYWEGRLFVNGLSLYLSGDAKPVEVPAGKYQVPKLALYQRDDAGRRVQQIAGSRTKPLTITEGKTTSLSLGKDMVVSIVTKISKGKVQFTVEHTDADGWQITSIYRAGRKKPQPPQVEVIDKAGKVIHLAKLEYG
jgi:hypothetical protein